ncbi:MAG: phosphopyruvate hydratase [bacterium]
MRIDHIEAKQILDTRGKPTIETTISANTFSAIASVPSGKSTGSHEALELRDVDGGVAQAVENVNNEIARAIVGQRFGTLDDFDDFLIELDGTPNKSRLGANALLSVSIAAIRLSASLEGIPLWSAIANRGTQHFGECAKCSEAKRSPKCCVPRLFVNVMEGGTHADFKLPFQEYLLVVEGKTSDALPIAQEMFSKIGEQLGTETPMGDESGYAPTFDTLEKPFELLAELIKEFPNVKIAIDAAASELLHDGSYELMDKKYSPDELATIYREIVERFPIHSIEDPFAENAPEDFAKLNTALGAKVLIIGDDLTVTDSTRIKNAAEQKAINAVIIKPNQIGTVKEALDAVQETYSAGFKAIASHRSGETNDTFIADFAYGIGAHGIKAGGFGQSERLKKYERLLAIENEAKSV